MTMCLIVCFCSVSQFVRVSGMARGELDKWLPFAKLRTSTLYSEVTRFKQASRSRLLDGVVGHVTSASRGRRCVVVVRV